MEIKAPVIREFKWLFRKITLLMVVYHTRGSCGLSKVCANGKQKSLVVSSILIAHFTIYSPTPNLLREPRIINSKMAAGTGEKLEMVTTFSIRKFRLKSLDYRWRPSVYFGNSPVGWDKITVSSFTEISGIFGLMFPLTFDRKFGIQFGEMLNIPKIRFSEV